LIATSGATSPPVRKSKALGIESERYAAKLVSQARTVLRHTPELAEKVRDGFALSEAYEAAMTVKRAPT
jgi:hypothetical protein